MANKVNLAGLRQLANRLNSGAVKGRMIEYQLRSTQRNFDRESDPDGNPWKPLAPATRKQKKNQRTLTEKGRLRKSINGRQTKDGFRLGTALVYARIHQEGGEIKIPPGRRTLNFKVGKDGRSRFSRRKSANFQQDVSTRGGSVKIPKRRFMGFSAEDIRQHNRIIAEEIALSQK